MRYETTSPPCNLLYCSASPYQLSFIALYFFLFSCVNKDDENDDVDGGGCCWVPFVHLISLRIPSNPLFPSQEKQFLSQTKVTL